MWVYDHICNEIDQDLVSYLTLILLSSNMMLQNVSYLFTLVRIEIRVGCIYSKINKVVYCIVIVFMSKILFKKLCVLFTSFTFSISTTSIITFIFFTSLSLSIHQFSSSLFSSLSKFSLFLRRWPDLRIFIQSKLAVRSLYFIILSRSYELYFIISWHKQFTVS